MLILWNIQLKIHTCLLHLNMLTIDNKVQITKGFWQLIWCSLSDMQFFMIGWLITDKSRSSQHSNHLIFCTPDAFPFFGAKKTCKRIAFSGFFLQKMHLPANILKKEWKCANTAIQDGYLTHSLLTFVVSNIIKRKLQWQKMFICVSAHYQISLNFAHLPLKLLEGKNYKLFSQLVLCKRRTKWK